MTTTTQVPPNRVSSCILFVTVAAAPLPFGSTDPSAIAFWCVVLGIGVAAVSPRAIRRAHLPLFGLAVLVVIGYAFVLHEQFAARPWIASTHPLWREAGEALGVPLAPSVSIARNQPYFSLGAPLANMLALICAFIVCLDRERARQLLAVVAWTGAGYAIYGIAAYVIDPTHLLWRDKEAYRDVLTSTFVNRNTAAVYFGSCALIWLLILCNHIRRQLPSDPREWRGVLRHIVFDLSFRPIFSFAMMLLCIAAMLMTNSRAGIVLSLLSLVVAFAAFFYRDLPRKGGLVTTLGLGALFALGIVYLLGGRVSGRFDVQGLSDEGRLDVYRSTWRMISDHPWFGTGLGTFVWSFPAYRTSNIPVWGIWDRAHSTPLELAADLGIPLASLVVLSWVIALAVLARGVATRRRDRIVPSAAFAVALLASTHSLLDFSLQIPGYAVIVFSLLGAGLAQSFSNIRTNSGDS